MVSEIITELCVTNWNATCTKGPAPLRSMFILPHKSLYPAQSSIKCLLTQYIFHNVKQTDMEYEEY